VAASAERDEVIDCVSIGRLVELSYWADVVDRKSNAMFIAMVVAETATSLATPIVVRQDLRAKFGPVRTAIPRVPPFPARVVWPFEIKNARALFRQPLRVTVVVAEVVIVLPEFFFMDVNGIVAVVASHVSRAAGVKPGVGFTNKLIGVPIILALCRAEVVVVPLEFCSLFFREVTAPVTAELNWIIETPILTLTLGRAQVRTIFLRLRWRSFDLFAADITLHGVWAVGVPAVNPHRVLRVELVATDGTCNSARLIVVAVVV
jgi:hypothetical protein